VRLAWFSPLPPGTSGIAAYSAELLPLLRRHHDIDVFVEGPPLPSAFGARPAHDFVWMARRTPYDLTVFQLGNASCHDYMWAYLFRYPGLIVLHDAQLHQARALWLTRRWQPRLDDYLAEFRANHPDAPADIGRLVAAGLGGTLYHHWPLLTLVLASARLTAVHNRRVMLELSERHPDAAIEAIEMGVADPLAAWSGATGATGATGAAGWPAVARSEFPRAKAGASIRERYGIPSEAIVVTAFGGVTPEKRIPAILAAAGSIARSEPRLHVLLVGARVEHYDVTVDVATHELRDRVHVAGFVDEADLPGCLQATDVCVCLRWPTSRETSASWLRCLAAGRPTIISDLVHLADVPTLDPRDWRVLDAGGLGVRPPVAVSVDVLDEEHSLRLAIERLCADSPLRARLGQAGRQWWSEHHRLEDMAAAYERLLTRAHALPPPRVDLPAHLVDDGVSHTRRLLAPFGLEADLVWPSAGRAGW
jgi:glycosyltransferase involved in cell wall biosynthesis